MGATAASRRYENSRPSAAPICAISLMEASRSRRATSESWRVAGIASDGSGAMAMYRSPAACSCPDSNTALGEFLNEQRHAVGPADDLTVDIWRQLLAFGQVDDHGADLLARAVD